MDAQDIEGGRRNSNLRLLLFIIVSLISLACGFCIGKVDTASRLRQEAVKNNCAYWSVDDKGETSFHWIPNAK